MSEIGDRARRTSAYRVGAVTGLVLLLIGAVCVASNIGFAMESPKISSSSHPGGIAWNDAIISEAASSGPAGPPGPPGPPGPGAGGFTLDLKPSDDPCNPAFEMP